MINLKEKFNDKMTKIGNWVLDHEFDIGIVVGSLATAGGVLLGNYCYNLGVAKATAKKDMGKHILINDNMNDMAILFKKEIKPEQLKIINERVANNGENFFEVIRSLNLA